MSFSHSSIKTYEQCPLKYKLSRIDKLKEEAGPAAERGKDIHYAFEQALVSLPVLHEDFEFWYDYVTELREKNVQAELTFGITKDWEPCDFNYANVWLRGIFDAIYITEDTAHILDWKTGKSRDYSEQLKLYAAIAFALYPSIKQVTTEVCYIDLKKREAYGTYTREDFTTLKTWIDNRIGKIISDDIYAPKPSFGCRWCGFRKSNGGPCKW